MRRKHNNGIINVISMSIFELPKRFRAGKVSISWICIGLKSCLLTGFVLGLKSCLLVRFVLG